MVHAGDGCVLRISTAVRDGEYRRPAGSIARLVGASWRLVFPLMEVLAILVANAAVWFVASRFLPAQPPWLAVGVIPGGLLLQLGLYGLIRSWRRRWPRAFWIGFVVVDSLVFWSYIKALVFTNSQTAMALTHWPNAPQMASRCPRPPRGSSGMIM